MSTFAARDKRCRNELVVRAQGAAWSLSVAMEKSPLVARCRSPFLAWSALRRCHLTPSRGKPRPLRDLAETEGEDP